MKNLSFLLSGFIFLLSSFVSAQSSQVFPRTREFFSGLYDSIIGPLFSFLLGGSVTPELFFAKILLFIIFLAVVGAIVIRFPLFTDRPSLAVVVALAVSILSIRLITDEWIRGILLPYNTLGVLVTAFLPFIFIVYFIYGVSIGKSLQRVAWVFAIAVFLGLYFIRDDVGPLAGIYLIVGIISIFALAFNNSINRFVHKHKLDRITLLANEDIIRDLRRQVVQLNEDLARGVIGTPAYRAKIRELEKKILDLSG